MATIQEEDENLLSARTAESEQPHHQNNDHHHHDENSLNEQPSGHEHEHDHDDHHHEQHPHHHQLDNSDAAAADDSAFQPPPEIETEGGAGDDESAAADAALADGEEEKPTVAEGAEGGDETVGSVDATNESTLDATVEPPQDEEAAAAMAAAAAAAAPSADAQGDASATGSGESGAAAATSKPQQHAAPPGHHVMSAAEKKEAMRKKARAQQKKFKEEIPEEGDDDEDHYNKKRRSPPMEPVSQNLDDTAMDKYNLAKHDDLIPSTPDRIDMTLDGEEGFPSEGPGGEVIEVKPTREEIIARYQLAAEERDRLQNINNQLHNKLADYFRKKKTDEQHQAHFDKSQDHEQRYLKYVATIDELKKQLEREKYGFEQELAELKVKCESKQVLVNEQRLIHIKLKRDAARKSQSTLTGRAPPPKEIEAELQREQQKELEVVSVRLENIKLKNQLKKKEAELKAKEELGEGLHMIDFEQLKIENQTYNEKIEERNEELMKLKKKINNTVQILSHVKEKLQFVNAENDKETGKLTVYEQEVKKKRDILNRTKQLRDSLRMDNNRLRQNSGLLGNGVLLLDFEQCVDENDVLEDDIELLKRQHAELLLSSKGLKQKITQTKLGTS